MFPAMRRWKQQLTQQECVEVLKQEPRGVLSLMGEDGYPYGLPIQLLVLRGGRKDLLPRRQERAQN
mgnify:CR=1 FL=1